jgi:hypothetical protein
MKKSYCFYQFTRPPSKVFVKAANLIMKPLGPESFSEATEQYREWLATKLIISNHAWINRLKVVEKQAPFAFLRATFYRWSQWWPVMCDELTDAPFVLGIGDLHLENFGTWRDKEGRLVWGVNDVDECCCLPYTNDLVRLATSALFALLDMDSKTEDLIKDLNEDKRKRNDVLDKFKNTTPGLLRFWMTGLTFSVHLAYAN